MCPVRPPEAAGALQEGRQGRRGRGAGRRRWEKEPDHVAPGGAPGAWELPHPTFLERKVRTGFLVGAEPAEVFKA